MRQISTFRGGSWIDVDSTLISTNSGWKPSYVIGWSTGFRLIRRTHDNIHINSTSDNNSEQERNMITIVIVALILAVFYFSTKRTDNKEFYYYQPKTRISHINGYELTEKYYHEKEH